MVTEIIVSSRESSGIVIYSYDSVSDLGYASDIVLLSEDRSKLQVFLDRMNDNVGIFRMWFALSGCKIPLQH